MHEAHFFILNHLKATLPNPSSRDAPGGMLGYARPTKPCRWRGKTAPSFMMWGIFVSWCVLAGKKPSPSGSFFVPPAGRMDLAVKPLLYYYSRPVAYFFCHDDETMPRATKTTPRRKTLVQNNGPPETRFFPDRSGAGRPVAPCDGRPGATRPARAKGPCWYDDRLMRPQYTYRPLSSPPPLPPWRRIHGSCGWGWDGATR